MNFSKGAGEYREDRVYTNWITLGPYRIARVPHEDRYILPGGKIVDFNYIESLAKQNDWRIKE
jgi:hypothetical protein